MTTTSRRSPGLLRIALLLGAVLLVVAALVFEPWKLVVDQQVDEAAPTAVVPAAVVPTAVVPTAAVPAPTASRPAPAPAPAPASAPATLARGSLISHEHASSGTVRILRLADGSRVLRLENLRTSNGPRLKVWLTDAPVLEGERGWYLFDDGRHVDLGDLKGNVGSSNYPIPAGTDLDALTSVSIWCDRFDVSFAAAALRSGA